MVSFPSHPALAFVICVTALYLLYCVLIIQFHNEPASCGRISTNNQNFIAVIVLICEGFNVPDRKSVV